VIGFDAEHPKAVMDRTAPRFSAPFLDERYVIEAHLGSGGTGAVYRAFDREQMRDVAIKVLHPRFAQRGDLLARLRREARALEHLTHPNTVRVFGSGTLDDGRFAIVLEYLRGQNMHWIRAATPVRRLPVGRVLPMIAQACFALHEAHAVGIVHRDIKPENLFVESRDRPSGVQVSPSADEAERSKDFVRVIDFGCARVSSREIGLESEFHTNAGAVLGTLAFVSPEQVYGKPVTAASDIYSLGVVAYEMLSGRLPFSARSPLAFPELHATQAPIPLDARVPGLSFPKAVVATVHRALAKRPEDRFASAHDFGDALLAALPQPTEAPETGIFARLSKLFG
jgi:serine/threonine-protein kinase